MRAATLRQQIETTLARRAPGALTPQLRRAPDRLAIGIREFDERLGGGLPIGAITEMVGPSSSGRTTLALCFVAERLRQGQVAAWIDASDTLDPESAAAIGVPLEQLLWVRCGATPVAQHKQESSYATQKDTNRACTRGISGDCAIASIPQSGGHGSPHPRSEARGLPEALQTLMMSEVPRTVRPHPGGNAGLVPVRRRDRSVGTPGAPNRSLTHLTEASKQPKNSSGDAARTASLRWRSEDREEQVATDRHTAKRITRLSSRLAAASNWTPSTFEPRCAEPQHHSRSRASEHQIAAGDEQPPHASGASPVDRSPVVYPGSAASPSTTFFKEVSRDTASPQLHAPTPSGSLQSINQALRAADLLLQASGFGAVVLDLGSIAPEVVWRIPLATWFRFRAAADHARTCLILLTQHPCSQSSAEIVLDLQPGHLTSSGNVVTGFNWKVGVARERFADPDHARNLVSIRKSPQPVRPGEWSRSAPWTAQVQPSPRDVVQGIAPAHSSDAAALAGTKAGSSYRQRRPA